MIWPIVRIGARDNFYKKNFPKLDFLKAVSVNMVADSAKMKMKIYHPILVSPTNFLKKFLPLANFFETLSSSLKRWVGGGRKLCFHLKIYLKLFNSFCVFLLEHIGFFWMFLLLLAITMNTIIQNKREDRQSVTSFSWARLTRPWKLLKPNKPTRQLSFWEFKILRWFTIIDYTLQNTLQDHALH